MFTLVLLEIAAIRIVRLPISPFHNNHLSQHFPLLTTMTSQTTMKMASVALDPSTIRQIDLNLEPGSFSACLMYSLIFNKYCDIYQRL